MLKFLTKFHAFKCTSYCPKLIRPITLKKRIYLIKMIKINKKGSIAQEEYLKQLISILIRISFNELPCKSSLR